MSLAVVNVGGSSPNNVGSNLLADLNLTNAQSVQIQQILQELQTGAISPVEARAQIAGIVSSAQQSAPSTTGQTSTPTTTSTPGTTSSAVATTSVVPVQTSYYELPLPQESLKGVMASYDSFGAATQTVFSGSSNSVNAQA